MTPRTTQARFEPLGRLWQQSWLDDVARGGPLVFADWLATLPRSIESAGRAAWRIDLVVLDMGLADREGMVLAQLIRTLGERGAMPILALVSGPRLPGKAAGISATLRKPYSPREFYGVMRDALGRVTAALSSDA